jgi:prophage regulatory protein
VSDAKRILRPKVVAERIGVSRATIYRMEKAGLLPPRLLIGPGCSGWLESDIDEFIESRPRGGASRDIPASPILDHGEAAG